MIPDDELMREFLQESETNMNQLESILLALFVEGNPPPTKEVLTDAFRMIHTLAGTCGFFGYQNLGALARAGESLLAAWRDESARPTPEGRALLLRTVTAVRETLAVLKSTKSEGPAHTVLVESLDELRTRGK